MGMNAAQVPAIEIVQRRLSQIAETISIESADFDFDKEVYTLHLSAGEREGKVSLPRELLDDLRDNPDSPSTKYSRVLDDKLTSALLEVTEQRGLIAFNESTLKFLLLKHVHQETSRGRPVHKYNAIGKIGRGSFESSLNLTLTREEKQTLIWVWDELCRLRLIAPTGEDLVNPDDWVVVTDKEAAAVEGRAYSEYVDEEVFINIGEVYTAYKKIKSIMKLAKKELLIIDPHVSDENIDMLSTVNKAVAITIITTYLHGDFKNAYKKLQRERGNIEARQSQHFHDRFIVVDRLACYQLGASIKDAGAKATVIDTKNEAIRDRILKEAEEAWNSGTSVS
jgi:hypothetical protein